MLFAEAVANNELLTSPLLNNPLSQYLMANNVSRIGPELLILACILFSIIASFNPSFKERQNTWAIALMGIFFSLGLILFESWLFLHMDTDQQNSWLNKNQVLMGMFQADIFSMVIRSLLLFGTGMVLLFSRETINKTTKAPAEFYVIMLSALLGAMLMAGANDLIMLFVGMETLGISSFIMAGYLRGDVKSTEASLKYLIYGAVSTAVILFGFSLLYGITGETSLNNILMQLTNIQNSTQAQGIMLLKAFPVIAVMILGGMAFKLSAAPFHMWTPDVYEGAPTPVTAFLSVVSKLAGFAVVLRVCYGCLNFPEWWVPTAVGFAVLSMVIGNVVALWQTNIKRLLAYSTIAHAGYMLIGLTILSPDSATTLLFYLMAYMVMNLGAFAVVIYFNQLTGSDEIKAYSGLIHKRPLLTLVMSFFMLSLAGMPITVGFFAKFFLFQVAMAISTKFLWVVILALLTSTVSMFYYLNILRLMVIGEPSAEVQAIQHRPYDFFKVTGPGLAIGICFIGTVLMGLYTDPIYNNSWFAMKQMHFNYHNKLKMGYQRASVPTPAQAALAVAEPETSAPIVKPD
jgi:NAD(P)H-quinone oxidoreductase subunit 2